MQSAGPLAEMELCGLSHFCANVALYEQTGCHFLTSSKSMDSDVSVSVLL